MPSSSDSIRSTGYALAKYALENGSVATRYLTLHGTPAMSTHDSPKSTSIVVPGSTLRCTKASFLVVAVLSPATYQRTVRAGSGPAIGSNNRRIRFAVNRGSSRSHCLIRSRHGSRVPGRVGDTRTGGVDRLMDRRTVFTSNFNRRAISFFGTLSTRCKCRISAHWDILITSASSWLGRRDDRVSPRRSSPGDHCSECSGGPFSCCRYHPGDLPELPDAHDDVIEVRSDDHGVDPAGADVQVTDGAVADIRAAPRQAVLEVRARFQMVAPAPAPEAVGDGASLDVDGLHVHAVPAQLVRDPGHSGAPGADGNVVVCPRQAGARASAGNSTRVGDKLPPAGSTGCVPARDRGMAEDGRAGGSAPSAMKVLRVGRGIGRQQQGMAWLFRVTYPPKPPLLAGAGIGRETGGEALSSTADECPTLQPCVSIEGQVPRCWYV